MNRSIVVLLFGGQNAEKEVSIASAQNLLSALPADCDHLLLFWRPDGVVQHVTLQQLSQHTNPYTAPFQPVYKQSQGETYANVQQAVAHLAQTAQNQHRLITFLLAVHGMGCEDGQLQQLLEQQNVPFTGSGSHASARAFNKIQAKQSVQQQAVLTADCLVLNPATCSTWSALAQQFFCQHGPLVMKPAQDGSSIGLQFLHTQDDVRCAIEAAGAKPRLTLLEPKLSGIELAATVLEDASGRLTALPCTQVKPQTGRCFDYAGKYLGDGVQEITPAQVPNALAQQAQAVAIAAHKAVGCRGYSRTDCIATDSDVLFLEINTLPGLSVRSFIPQQLQAAGIALQQFVATQLHIAQRAACPLPPATVQAAADD
ncbi:MAG: hypothetical protein AAF310_04035 [Myxococcota bacterium]